MSRIKHTSDIFDHPIARKATAHLPADQRAAAWRLTGGRRHRWELLVGPEAEVEVKVTNAQRPALLPLADLHRLPLSGFEITDVRAPGTVALHGRSVAVAGGSFVFTWVWAASAPMPSGRQVQAAMRSSRAEITDELDRAVKAIFQQYPGAGAEVVRDVTQAAMVEHLLTKHRADTGPALSEWLCLAVGVEGLAEFLSAEDGSRKDVLSRSMTVLARSPLPEPGAPSRRAGLNAAVRRELATEAWHASKPGLMKSRKRKMPLLGDIEQPSPAAAAGRRAREWDDPTGNRAMARAALADELAVLRFTDHQLEVAVGILSGFTQAEVALQLGISRSTVGTIWGVVQKKLPDL